MNGLNPYEIKTMDRLRRLVTTDRDQAKKQAAEWILANKRRIVIRRAGSRTIRGLHAH